MARTGRPRKTEGAKRTPLNLKTSAELRQRIERSADASGLSLTQEVERVLLRSYDGEDSLGGPETATFLRLLAQIIQRAEMRSGKPWTADFATWDTVRRLVEASIRTNRPPPPRIDDIRDVASDVRAADAADVVEARLVQLELACGPLDRALDAADVAATEIAGLLRIVMKQD